MYKYIQQTSTCLIDCVYVNCIYLLEGYTVNFIKTFHVHRHYYCSTRNAYAQRTSFIGHTLTNSSVRYNQTSYKIIVLFLYIKDNTNRSLVIRDI